jgi:aryl-alcohol dehydrogenase-like predicted oxidoreductase
VLSDEALGRVKALSETARDHGHSVLELAIAWLLSHGPVASVIAGATKPEQVWANVEGAKWKLGEDLLARIDDIAPRQPSA